MTGPYGHEHCNADTLLDAVALTHVYAVAVWILESFALLENGGLLTIPC